MRKEQAKKRIEKLRQVINQQRYIYHVLDRQDMSDEAHDSLKHELWQLEQQFPDLVTPDSPTQRVGGEALDKFEKVEHGVPMLSIEDIFTEEGLQDWEEYIKKLSGPFALEVERSSLEYFVELKVDGFAVSLLYENGVFVQGGTRGNGRVGEDVTQNLKTIESIPLKLESASWSSTPRLRLEEQRKLKIPSRLVVRGEVYMEKKSFEQFNKERQRKGQEPFANPRNLAAGSIRQLDPKLAAARPLRFMAYGLAGDQGQRTHEDEHAMVRSLGFKTDQTARKCATLKEVVAYWKNVEKKRNALPFHIDGIVVTVNDNSVFQKLGVAGKGYRAMRALKFPGKQVTTKIVDIQTQVGRTGVITPVAILEPAQVAGVTISRATLHNEDEIRRLGVKIGDTVVVERAGDVIPAVVQVLPELRDGSERSFVMPSRCFSCGSKLIREKGEVAWKCSNKDCQAQKRESLYHFVSRKAFDMEGVGPKIIDQLMEQGLVRDAPDLFELREGDLISLERFADRSASNLVEAIKQSKRISLARFLYALGIRHVGEETANALAHNFQFSLPAGGFQNISLAELQRVPDIGPKVAESIYGWFHAKENLGFLKRLQKVGVRIQNTGYPSTSLRASKIPARNATHSVAGGQDTKLRGKIFVLTGSLESMTRDEAKAKIRELGGVVVESVSKKTDYVVVGKNPGSKLNQAKKLNIRIVSEKKFIDLLRS